MEAGRKASLESMAFHGSGLPFNLRKSKYPLIMYNIKRVPAGLLAEGTAKKQKAGLLTQQQMADLNRLDMVWTQIERREWDSWYTLAAAYFCEHGHLLVPFDYKSTDGHKLGQWMHVQRERYKGKRRPLSAAQVKALENISMVWSLSDTRTEKWDSMYQWVADYRSNNGKLPLRPSLLAPDGRSMGNWISVQRTALSQGKLSKDKAERLKLLEIFPFGYQK